MGASAMHRKRQRPSRRTWLLFILWDLVVTEGTYWFVSSASTTEEMLETGIICFVVAAYGAAILAILGAWRGWVDD
jgi:hypothetical protein